MTPGPYRPRRMAPLPVWTCGELRLKPYTITLAGAGPSAAVLDAARSVAGSAVPAAADAEGEASGLGFAIVHEGEAGTWQLLDWWAHGDICCGRLFRADPGGSHFVPMDHRALVACVWEMRIIDHESRAWVRTMMTDRPDPPAYLADGLEAGFY